MLGFLTAHLNKQILTYMFIFAILLALPLTVIVSQQQQDIRQRASELVSPPFVSQPPVASFGKAAKFNNDTSNNAYATVTTTKLATGNPFTVEAWIKVAKPTSGNYLRGTRIITYINPQLPSIASGRIFSLSTEVQETSGTSRPAFGALLDKWTDIQNGHLAYISVGQGSGGDTTLQPDEWYHIAVTSYSEGNKCFMKMYINGVLMASRDRSSPDLQTDCQISKQNPQELIFSKTLVSEGGVSGYYYSGEIDEVRISNMVRYTANFNISAVPFSADANTLALYHFDGDVNDATGNGNNGTINGDVQFVDSTISVAQPVPTSTYYPYPAPSSYTTPSVPDISPTPTPISSSFNRVFVTSTTYNGDLKSQANALPGPAVATGLDGGDKICQTRANVANLGGIWKAWLSTSTVNAKDRILDTEYRRLDDRVIANNKEDLIDGALDAGIVYTEFNTSVYNSSTTLGVFTGTNQFGVVAKHFTAAGAIPSTCSDWTQILGNNVKGMAGTAGDNHITWTSFDAGGCGSGDRLYCFEQIVASVSPTPTPTPIPPTFSPTPPPSPIPTPTSIATPTPTPVDLCTICSADVNKDGVVNNQDSSLVNSCLDKPKPISETCNNSDANKDGKIDLADANCVLKNTSKTCPSNVPAKPTATLSPTPIPTAILTPTPKPKIADLVVSSINIVGTPLAGRSNKFNVGIYNQGTATVNAFERKKVVISLDIQRPNGSKLGTCSQNLSQNLPSGRAATVSVTNCRSFDRFGTHRITATVDSTRVVSESKENNNTKSTTVNVR